MQIKRIRSVKSLGIQKTLDFEVNHKDHNFYGNNTVISNSHSTAYGETAILSIFLKFKYPLEFFLEALKLSKEYQKPTEDISEISRELPHFGIKLLPPDLVKSDIDFKIEGKNIRYGLSAIKSVAQKSIAKVQEFIDKEKINMFSLFQAAIQSKINSTIMIALIESGAMSELCQERQKATLSWRIFKKLTPREMQYCLINGEKYDFDIIKALKDYLNWIDSSGKIFTKEKRLETLRKDCEPYFQIYRENSKNPKISEFVYEKALLGFSNHKIKDLFSDNYNLKGIHEIKTELYPNDKVSFVAEVLKVNINTSKKTEKKYCKMEVADEEGTIEVAISSDKWERYCLENKIPEKGQVFHFKGSKAKEDNGFVDIWLDTAAPQFLPVYMRIQDIKKLEAKEKKTTEADLEISENS